jgi:hypothetical protein
MKARNILIVFLLITAFSVQPLEAQRTFSSQNMPSLKKESHGAFWQSPSIGLTEAQIKELESLQQAFIAEAMPLRRELMSLRFELRHLIRDPNVGPEILLDRQRKISKVQTKLDSLSLSYLVKARSVFTKDQLEQLPSDCSLGIEVGFGVGIDRELRKGLR